MTKSSVKNGPGGWAGTVLRVDLSTGRITRESTVDKYADVLGGTGIGYQALWELVPTGTKPFDPANILAFATGPLAGTSVPCSGRTAITTIFPTSWPKPVVASGHMGGQFAAQLKYAGYDGLIVEGRADRPVWLLIRDAKIEIRDARPLWGMGIRQTTEVICREIGAEAVVAAIGPTGENLAPMAAILNSFSHSAGGVGGVMGSKNLKAVAVLGSGPVRIAGDKGEWEKLINLHSRLMGANNQHVVPSFPHPQAEYYNPHSRWIGEPGKVWGASNPPLPLPDDILSPNHTAYRTNSAAYFLGPQAWKHTVRGSGCSACPIRCHTLLRSEDIAKRYGISQTVQSTCIAMVVGARFYKDIPGGLKGAAAFEANMLGMHYGNELGIWSNYGQITRDFIKLYYDGILKRKLSSQEYASIPWDLYEKGDPAFIADLLQRIAYKRGELGTALGLGTGPMFDHWSIPESDWLNDKATLYWKMGHPRHHANDDDGQCGVVINAQYNRDAQCHSHTNFLHNGLPVDVQKKLAADLWGSPEAFDPVGAYTPVNIYKMRRAKWAVIRKELHDSLALCNWMGPWVASPLKERGYSGDNSLESRLYSVATGRKLDREGLDRIGERIFTLHRALTIRDMNTTDMRGKHDLSPEWIYDSPNGAPAFTKGTIHMDRADMAKALDLFYESLGWDKTTGAPTLAAYRNIGLDKVGHDLDKAGLLPEKKAGPKK